MKVDNFMKKHRIKKIYAYHEERQDKNTMSFGWVPSKALDLNNPVVVSSVSKSKKVSESDREWSEKEGNSVASLSDYKKYFEALTGESSDEFISKWGFKEDELEELRKRANKRYKEGEGSFLLSLARLISDDEKFSSFGRVYKVVDPNT
jgi:hypothetical protein